MAKHSSFSALAGGKNIFVVVKKSVSEASSLRYHLPSGASVKHVDADMLKRANAKSGAAIRSALSRYKP